MGKKHKTVKVDADIHEQFKRYCLERNVPLGAFTEGLFLCALSGSISGSEVAEMAFRKDHDVAVEYGDYSKE